MKTVLPIILLMLTLVHGAAAYADAISDKRVAAALKRTESLVIYNGRYENIPYPMGDVKAHFGVWTDVIIRSYRKIGFDFQQAIHEDMVVNFTLYPKLWGLKNPDSK